VLVNWTWNYFRYDRANRLVTDDDPVAANAGDAAPDERDRTAVEAHR